jgi:hypothetical protein
MQSGLDNELEKYKDKSITDIHGKKHFLETRLDKVKEIELSRENIELADIYAY